MSAVSMTKHRSGDPYGRVRECWVSGCTYKTRPTTAGQAEARLKEHMGAKHPGEWEA